MKKIALLLSIVSATLILNGCSTTNRGGTSDESEQSTGTMQQGTMEQTSPGVLDPSLPQDPNVGPSIPPP